jgi:ribosomal protein S18 acetylase RimI-like enzyme
MFPKAEYPLKAEVLLKEAESRFYPTVVISDHKPAGYGNFIHAEHGNLCTVGNVIVNPAMRRTGVASYLVETLLTFAFYKLKSLYVKISCFNNNTAGLLLYHKLGFIPVDMEVRLSRSGQKVALIHILGFIPVDMEVRLSRSGQKVALIHMHNYKSDEELDKVIRAESV